MKVECTSEQVNEAAVWMTLLNSPERNAQVDRGLKRWLAAHSGNARAFAAASRGWEAAGLMPKGPFPHHLAARQPGPPRRWLPVSAAAAILVLAVAGVLAYGRYAGVSTDIGEQRIVTLQDGTRVFLNTDTRMVVTYNSQLRLVELKSGEAYFDVAKQRPDWPFVVSVGDRRIRALGTSFVVRRDTDRLSVILLEGKVAVTRENSAPIALKPGQRLTLRPARAPEMDEPVLEKVTSWRTGYLDLPVMPLAEAIAEMNRYSRQRIRLAEPASGDIPVSGVFRAGDTQSFATAVAEGYGLEVVMEGGGIVLKK